MKRKQLKRFLFISGACISFSACSAVKLQQTLKFIDPSISFGEPKTIEDCKDIEGTIDKTCQEYLEAKKYCEAGEYDKVQVPASLTDKKWALDLRNNCKAKAKEAGKQAEQEKLAAVQKGNDAIKASSCDDLQQTWTTHKSAITNSHFATEKGSINNFVAAGKKFAECDQWDFLIQNLFHWGGKKEHGAQLIAALGKDGVNLESKMIPFLKKNPMKFENSGFAAMHYTDYLIDNNLLKKCKDYIGPSKKMPEEAWDEFAFYFQDSKCKKAADSVQQRLSSEKEKTRILACATLGKIGSKKHLKKMKSVAKTDSYYKKITLTKGGKLYIEKEYTVRDACKIGIEALKNR